MEDEQASQGDQEMSSENDGAPQGTDSNSEGQTNPSATPLDAQSQPLSVPPWSKPPPGQALADFVLQLEDFNPSIPDAVTMHYLNSAGFETSDPRIVRLISLAAQKFISDVVNDALQINKMRGMGSVPGGPAGSGTGVGASGASGANTSAANLSAQQKKALKDKKLTLTMEDLAPALAEYNISLKKPPYFN